MLQRWKLILANWINCYSNHTSKDEHPLHLKSLLSIISHLRENLNLDESSRLEAVTVEEFIQEKYPTIKFENGTVEPTNEDDICIAASLLLFFVCVNSKNMDIKYAMCSKLSSEDQETILKFSKSLMECSAISCRDVHTAITDACGQDVAAIAAPRHSVAETPPALRSLHSEVRRLQAALDAERFDRNYLQDELSRTSARLERLLKEKEQYKLDIVNLKAKISLCCGEQNDAGRAEEAADRSVQLARQLEQLEDRLVEVQGQLDDIVYERDTYKTKVDELKQERDKWLAHCQQETARVSQISEELDTERRHVSSLRDLVAELRQHNRLNGLDSSSLECDDPDASIHSLQHNTSVCNEACANVVEVQLGEERAKIVVLQQQTQSLQDQINELNQKAELEKNNLETIVADRENDIFNLKHRINEEIEHKNNLKTHCDNEMTKLNNEINELEQKLKDNNEHSRSIIEKKMAEIQTLQEEKLSLLHSLNDESTKLENIIKGLKDEIDKERHARSSMKEGYENHIMKLNEKVLNRNNELVELQNSIFEKGDMIETLQIELRKEKEAIKELTNKYHSLNEQKNEIESQLHQKCDESKELLMKIEHNDTVIKDMSIEFQHLKESVSTLSENFKTLEGDKVQLLNEIKNRDRRLEETAQEINHIDTVFKKEKEKLLQDMDERNATINSLQVQLQNEIQFKIGLQNELTHLQKTNETLSEEFGRANSEIAKLKVDIEDKDRTIDAMDLYIQEEKKRNEQANEKIQELTDDIILKQNDIEVLNDNLESTQKSLQEEIQNNVDNTEIANNKLLSEIAEKETLQLQLVTVLSEKDQLEKDLAVKFEEVSSLRDECNTLSQNLAENESYLNELKSVHNQAKVQWLNEKNTEIKDLESLHITLEENFKKDIEIKNQAIQALQKENEKLHFSIAEENKNHEVLIKEKDSIIKKLEQRLKDNIVKFENLHEYAEEIKGSWESYRLETKQALKENEDTIAKLNEQAISLEQKINEVEQSKGELTKQIIKLEAKKIEFENLITEEKAFRDTIETEKERIIKENKDLLLEKEKILENKAMLTQELSEERSVKKIIEEEKNMMVSENIQIKKQLAQKLKTIDTLLQEKECLAQQLIEEKLAKEISEKEKYIFLAEEKQLLEEKLTEKDKVQNESINILRKQVEALEKCLTTEKESLNILKEEKDKLNKELTQQKARNENLMQENRDLFDENDELKQDLLETRSFLEILKAEKESIEGVLNAEKTARDQIETEKYAINTVTMKLESDLMYKQEENKYLLEDNEKLKQGLVENKKMQDVLTEKYEKLLSEKKLLISEKESLISEIESHISENSALLSEKEAMLSEKVLLASTNNALTSEKEYLISEIESLIAEKKSLVSEKESLISINEALISEKKSLMSEKESLASENELLISEKDSLVSEKALLISEIGSLTSEKELLISEKELLISEKESLTSEKELLISEMGSLTSENKLLTSEKESLISEKKMLISEMESFTLEKQSLISEKELLILEKESQASGNETLMSEITSLISEKQSLVSEKNSLISKIESLNSAKEFIVSEKQSLISEKESLATKLATEKSARDELETEKKCKIVMLDDLNAKFSKLMDVLAVVDASLGLKEFDEIETTLKQLVTDYKDLQENNIQITATVTNGLEKITLKFKTLNDDSLFNSNEGPITAMTLEEKCKEILRVADVFASEIVSLRERQATLKNENEILLKTRETLKQREMEVFELQTELKRLEQAINENKIELTKRCETYATSMNSKMTNIQSLQQENQSLHNDLDNVKLQLEVKVHSLKEKLTDSELLTDKLKASYECQIENLNVMVTKLTNYLKDKTQELDALRKEKEQLQMTVEDYRKVIKSLEDEVKTQRQNADKIISEFESERQVLQNMVTVTESVMEDQKLTLNNNISEHIKSNEHLQAENGKIKTMLKDIEMKHHALELANGSLLSLLRLERMVKGEVEKESEIVRDYLDEVIGWLNKERNNIMSVITDLKSREADLNGELVKLRNDLEVNQQVNEELKLTKKALENDHQTQREEFTKLLEEKCQVDITLKENTQSLNDVNIEVKELKNKINEFVKEKFDLEDEKAKCVARLDEVEAQIKLREVKENEEITKLKTENQELLKSIEQNKADLEVVRQVNEELKLVKNALENDLKTQREEVTKLLEEKHTFEERTQSLNDVNFEVKELNSKINKIIKEKTDLEQEKTKYVAQLDELKAKLALSEIKGNEEITKLKIENQELHKSIDENKSVITNLEQLIKHELDENHRLREYTENEKQILANKITQLQENQTKTEKELEDRNNEIVTLQKEVETLLSKVDLCEQDSKAKDGIISMMSKEKDAIINTISKELVEEKTVREKYEKELETQKTTVNELKNHMEIRALRKENEQLIRAIGQQETFTALCQEKAVEKYACVPELRDLKVDNSSSDNTQSSMESLKTITDLEKIIHDKNRTITTLQSDITYLKSMIADSETKLLDINKELEMSKDQCQQLSIQLKKIVNLKNDEIAELKKQVNKLSVTENRASQIIKVSAKYQAIILKRIAEIKSNSILKELTNFGNSNNCDNDLRRGLTAGTVTMEDLENFLETTDRHLKRCAEKQIALQKERDVMYEVNRINESEILNLKKFLTELSVSFQTFSSVKDLYTQKLSRVISVQRTVRREILNLDGRITDAAMCKLERGYGAVMQDLSECAMNLERWMERCISRTVSVEKIKQAFTSDSERSSLASPSFQNTGLEIQLDELDKSFQKILEEVARAAKGDGARDVQATTVMEVRAEYEDKLNRMKSKMKDLFNEQMTVIKEKQREEIALLKRELQKNREKMEESKRAYERHIKELTKELWNVGEKYLVKNDEAEWLRKKQRSGSLMSLQHVHSSGLMPPQEPPSRPSDAHSLRSLPVTNEQTSKKREGRGLHMSDEEGEVFDNRCLKELSTPRRDPPPGLRLSELKWRNSLCPPHLKSSYPAETQFTLALDEEDIKAGSMGHGGRPQRKEVGITAYKKPGPPTPSKQAGRLSATDSELRESLRVENDPYHERKTSTPARIRAFLGFNKNDNTKEATPRARRLSNIFRKK